MNAYEAGFIEALKTAGIGAKTIGAIAGGVTGAAGGAAAGGEDHRLSGALVGGAVGAGLGAGAGHLARARGAVSKQLPKHLNVRAPEAIFRDVKPSFQMNQILPPKSAG